MNKGIANIEGATSPLKFKEIGARTAANTLNCDWLSRSYCSLAGKYIGTNSCVLSPESVSVMPRHPGHGEFCQPCVSNIRCDPADMSFEQILIECAFGWKKQDDFCDFFAVATPSQVRINIERQLVTINKAEIVQILFKLPATKHARIFLISPTPAEVDMVQRILKQNQDVAVTLVVIHYTNQNVAANVSDSVVNFFKK